MRTIALINQKGGCGKTTSSINLAACLAGLQQRTLLVDMDPQGHCAVGLAVPENQIEHTIYDVLARQSSTLTLKDIAWQIATNFDLAPATITLAALEPELHGLEGRQDRLADALSAVSTLYDFCIIDCPPNVGLLTFNAMRASGEVIIPVETGFFSLHGLGRQLELIDSLRKQCSQTIRVRILATLYDIRTKLAREVLADLRQKFGDMLMESTINFNTKLKEAASFGQPITEYDPASKGFRDFVKLAKELLGPQPRITLNVNGAWDNALLGPGGNGSNGQRGTPGERLPAAVGAAHHAEARPAGAPRGGAGNGTRPTQQTSYPAPHGRPAPQWPAVSPQTPAAPGRVAEPALAMATHATPADRTAPVDRADALPEQPAHTGAFGPTLAAVAAAPVAAVMPITPAAPVMASVMNPIVDSPTDAAPPSALMRAAQDLRQQAQNLAKRAQEIRSTAQRELGMHQKTAAPHHALAEDAQEKAARMFGVHRVAAGMQFIAHCPNAQAVSVAGDFNGWSATSTQLANLDDPSIFRGIVQLPPGRYLYRLVIDGAWVADPHNPMTEANPFGDANSVLDVR